MLDNLQPLTERMNILNENKSSKSMFEIKEEELIKAKVNIYLIKIKIKNV